jgi:branched-chain amino acid transport system permease protein
VGPPPPFQAAIDQAEPPAKAADVAYKIYMDAHPTENEYSLSDVGQKLLTRKQDADRKLQTAQDAASTSAWTITFRYGELIIFCTSILLMLLLTYLVMFTKQGRAMRAVAHDFDSASLMGVNVNHIITFTFVLGSSLAGAGAMMQTTFKGTTLTTFFGLLPGVKAFVAAVLGGIGNIPGAVLGGILMGVAETLVIWTGNSRWSDAIAFVILIAVLLFRPGGLLGSSAVEKV